MSNVKVTDPRLTALAKEMRDYQARLEFRINSLPKQRDENGIAWVNLTAVLICLRADTLDHLAGASQPEEIGILYVDVRMGLRDYHARIDSRLRPDNFNTVVLAVNALPESAPRPSGGEQA